MKILKKISLVYALQIFAVILLFGYAVASPVNKTKKKTSPRISAVGVGQHAICRASRTSRLIRVDSAVGP